VTVVRPPSRPPVGQVLALGGLSGVAPLALDMYLPGLPVLTSDLDATQAAGQLTLSFCMIGLALGQLLVGPLTDRVGRRVPLLVGTVLFALTAGLSALAPSIAVLLGLRLVCGLAGGAGIVIARAMVRDLYSGPTAARMFSLLAIVSNVAPVVAPLLGGLLLRFTTWRGVFGALAGLGVLLLVAALTQRETLPPARRHTGGLRATGRVLATVLRDRTFVVPALVLGAGLCGMFAYIAMASFVLQGPYGLDAQQFSLVFGANSVAILVAGQIGLALVGRLGPRRLLTGGVLVALGAAVAMLAGVLASPSVWALLPPLFLLVSCTGVILPNATALALEGQGETAGTASAVIGLTQFAFAAVVPPLASLRGVTPTVMAGTILGTAAAATVLWFAARPPVVDAGRAAAAGPGG
jgi:MFS transporter, DHA1 family, multidrug resistance protein